MTTERSCDIYLALQTKRAGKIKGEAKGTGHADEIVVAGWGWNVSAGAAIGSSRETARRSYSALSITKYVDAATPPLMAALATNDEVKEARLVMRRAGGTQEDFFTLTLKGARIASIQHQAGQDGGATETLSITFTQVEIEYRPQKGTGQSGGAVTFSDVIATGA